MTASTAVLSRFEPLAASPRDALRSIFGFDDFRPGQSDAIARVDSGRDCLIVMPTGAGKSLCYQLPACTRPGVTLVVSPLIALMKDQVDALQAQGVPATFVNSTLPASERRARLEDVFDGVHRLLYVAPERFRNDRFRATLQRIPVSMVVVDEAHCVSQWGHDFRPDYLRIADLRQWLGGPQIVALTATATRAVQADIVEQLGMEEPDVFVRGFERPNLFFEVFFAEDRDHKFERLVAILEAFPGESAVVYCATRKKVEAVAAELVERGVRAAAYHAGLSARVRDETQDRWMTGDLPVLVATNAFGMGVDKPDVRAIAHWDITGSVEAYYQEAGRAGRDGAEACCALLFNYGDRGIRDFFVENTHPARERIEAFWTWLCDHERDEVIFELPTASEELGEQGVRLHPMGIGTALRLLRRFGHVQSYRTRDGVTRAFLARRVPSDELRIDWKHHVRRREIAMRQLEDVVDYATSTGCLQARLVHYFGAEPSFGHRCGHCSGCVPYPPYVDDGHGRVAPEVERTVKILLSAVARMNGARSVATLVAVLRGKTTPVIQNAELDMLSVHGLLVDRTRREVVDMLEALAVHAMVRRNDRRYYELTPWGTDVMVGRAPVWQAVAASVESVVQ